ncbi:DUF2505 domain-containing protein [Rhodococcus gannanensis]|jgi:uncharacterized protein YndB with AHSA1/START domain|uniref:DUF2505 domain-containing protein n=1 Tax=Rhodococcus gannanensis TaxID=1960308 RepID=A0ABW4PAS3_9NOCA
MSRRIELTLTYNAPAAAVHSALTNRDFWLQRVEKSAENGVVLDHLDGGEGTIDVAISQALDKSALPGMVSKAVKGDLVLTRGEAWGPFENGQATGTFTVSTTGLPITANGTAVLADAGQQSTLTLQGEVEVAIKLIGGAIEGMVADQVIGPLLQRDQTATEEWVAANA